MSGELNLKYVDTDVIVKAIIYGPDRTDRWDNVNMVAVSSIADADWTDGMITCTELQTSDATRTGTYVGDFPAIGTAGEYVVEFFLGGSPSPGDLAIGIQTIWWDGSAAVRPAAAGDKMNLTDAAQQDLLQARYKTKGTVWCVAVDGNDGNSGLSPDQAKLTPKTVIEAASARDVVLLGPGTFALGDNVINTPNGVSVYGSGIDVTWLTSTAELLAASKGCIVNPGSDAEWADMTIHGTLTDGTFQAVFGVRYTGPGGQEAFVRAVGRNLRLIADTDGVYILHSSSACSLTLFDSIIESKYDGVIAVTVNSSIVLINTPVIVIGPSASGDGKSRSVHCENGIVRLYDCNVRATNGGATETIGYGCGTNGTIEVYGGSVYTAGSAGDVYDAENNGTLLMLSGVDYDRTKTSGTITDGTQSAQILDDTAELQANQGAWLTATGFNTIVPDLAGTAASLHGSTNGLIGALNNFDGTNATLHSDYDAAKAAAAPGAEMDITSAALVKFATEDTGEVSAVSGSVAKIAQGAAGGNVTVEDLTTAALAKFATQDTGETTAVAGSVSKLSQGSGVTVLPLQASASGSGRLSPNYLTAYQYAKIEATLLILDADDNPVDLSAVDLSFRAWQKDTPGTVEITMLSTGGSPELTVGGDDNNQVTIAGGVAHTADAAQYDWRLYDTTNSRAVATGTLEVEAGAEMSGA